jgi:hypothetical protein
MFMYALHTFDSHPVSAEGSRAGKLVGFVEKHCNQAAEDLRRSVSATSDGSATATEHRLDSLCAAQGSRPVFPGMAKLLPRNHFWQRLRQLFNKATVVLGKAE